MPGSTDGLKLAVVVMASCGNLKHLRTLVIQKIKKLDELFLQVGPRSTIEDLHIAISSWSPTRGLFGKVDASRASRRLGFAQFDGANLVKRYIRAFSHVRDGEETRRAIPVRLGLVEVTLADFPPA